MSDVKIGPEHLAALDDGRQWRTPLQLAVRRAARQRRIARTLAFQVAGRAPSQATMAAIAARLTEIRAHLEKQMEQPK